jgi:hypothetical protein
MTQLPPEPPGDGPQNPHFGTPEDPQRGWPQQPQQNWSPPPAPGGWVPPAPGGWAPSQPGGAAPSQPGGWGPPQPGGWGPPQPGDQQAWGSPQPTHPPKSHVRGKVVASAAAVIAVAAGAIVTYVATSDTNSAGAASPQKAVQSIVTDLNKSDLVGVLDDLPRGERDALINPVLDEINELKRLKVLQSGADPKKITGISVQAKALTFSDKTITINDHVRVVELTGGTLDINSDAAKVPFTKQFLDTVFPDGLPAQSTDSTHVDIAEQVREHDNKPVRIATQKISGRWYPSLFYTIADAAANYETPAAADAIPAAGGSSPQDALTRMVNALLQADIPGAIKLLSPDELAAVHDYGGLIVDKSGTYGRPDVTLKDLQVTTTKVSGDATRVLLKSVTVATGSGEQTTVKVDGTCVDVTTPDQHKRMCASDFVAQVIDAVQGFGVQLDVTSAQRHALENLLGGLTKVGVDTTESGGQWYLNPVRSYLDVTTSVLTGLQDNDLLELLGFFSGLGSH